jgi:hypothetical protein
MTKMDAEQLEALADKWDAPLGSVEGRLKELSLRGDAMASTLRVIAAAHEAKPHPDTVRLDAVIKHHIKVYDTMRGGFFALYPDGFGGNVATEYHTTPRAAIDEALQKLEANHAD